MYQNSMCMRGMVVFCLGGVWHISRLVLMVHGEPLACAVVLML